MPGGSSWANNGLMHRGKRRVKLHQEVERLRTGREPYNPRFVFFIVGVAFFVLLAFSAATPASAQGRRGITLRLALEE
jgi:hypothetical protein